VPAEREEDQKPQDHEELADDGHRDAALRINPGLPADGTRLAFETKVPGGVRAGGGVTLRLIGIGITGEYSSGAHNTVSVKAGVSIR
jgi:hypothetical protein